MNTRGQKSSERKAAYHAFLAGFILGGLSIWKGADLTGTGILIGAVTMPLMAYGGFRTALKRVQGER